MSQEPVLFKRNIYENILYGKLDSSEKEVYNAANTSLLSKFLNYGEIQKKEEHVSWGEKQRISTRAFLKNPKILLLDEATSSLDKETEKDIQKNIFIISKGRTSITVAHRLNTIINSDRIYVMESGKIVESGNHKNLLELKGKHYDLYKCSEK